jgi:hypothetical protein
MGCMAAAPYERDVQFITGGHEGPCPKAYGTDRQAWRHMLPEDSPDRHLVQHPFPD